MTKANFALANPAATNDDLDLEKLVAGDLSEEAAPKDLADTSLGQDGKQEFLKKFQKSISGSAIGKKKKQEHKKVRPLLRRALQEYKKNEFRECAKLTLEALKLDEEHAQGHHIMAMALEQLGELHKALQMYERSMKLDPSDPELYLNLGLLAWRMKMFDGAEKLFRVYIEMNPNHSSGYNNLAGVLRDKGQIDDAIEVLRQTIFRMPESAELWNSLGTVTMENGQLDESLTFYEEATRLAPEFARAYHNISYLLMHREESEKALGYSAKALKLTPENHKDYPEMFHNVAIAEIDIGNLEKGWDDYEIRHDLRFRGATIWGFTKPRWKDEDLTGKRIMVIGEQGIGDEIMFATAIDEMIEDVGPEGQVMIAVDHRLVSLFERSFPKAVVGHYVGAHHNAKLVRLTQWQDEKGGIDIYTPMGSTLRHYRRSLEDFPRKAFMTPDPERVAFWKDRLNAIDDKPKVGVCWRSMIMTTQRKKYFSPMELWGPIFENKEDVTFINLQYGDCKDDIADALRLHGVEIHNFEDLDLKDDLDDNAALCKALDLVISAPTAASAIAGSVGTEVWFPLAGRVWPMLGSEDFPWYPKNRTFKPEEFRDFEEVMARTGAALGEYSKAHQTRKSA